MRKQTLRTGQLVVLKPQRNVGIPEILLGFLGSIKLLVGGCAEISRDGKALRSQGQGLDGLSEREPTGSSNFINKFPFQARSEDVVHIDGSVSRLRGIAAKMAPIPPYVARVTETQRGVELHTTPANELLTVSSRTKKAGYKIWE